MDHEARRPRLTGDEDELMQMQQDFLAGRIQKSSVEIIKAPRSNNAPTSSASDVNVRQNEPRKSIFAQKREEMLKESKRPVHIENPQVVVLKDIIEKCDLVSAPSPSQVNASAGPFPAVFRLEKSIVNPGRGVKSIFARQIEMAGSSPQLLAPVAAEGTVHETGLECSRMARAVLGETEAAKIHRENLEKLSNMSQEEILQERELLLSKLDPKLVALLKRKETTGRPSPAPDKE